ncbi:MAG: cell division FtsA domain-containing protein [Schwartzia sp. (in: firmicutes)]
MPRKNTDAANTAPNEADIARSAEEIAAVKKPKAKRGRPSGSANAVRAEKDAAATKTKKATRAKKAPRAEKASKTTGRGRKPKAAFALPPSAAEKAQHPAKGQGNLLFALDIGTRSVIGIVAAEEADGSLSILDTQRAEHKTRAMLDGQIHDVPQVAAIIRDVKEALEKTTGPLHRVAVAAAGRALYTMTAEAEMEFGRLITGEEERLLDFAAVQAAQAQLAASDAVDDPTRYYCVGYSTIKYLLDDTQLKTLVGQRGRVAKATVIATFLPRQVIDSMASALDATGLDLQAITLEPIAAINVLIPPTMRHLNLVLVDIGAGTSDVAITKDGAVIAYGMVPLAGDEITEAISQNFLLDFNVAERIKREAAEGRDVSFDDILGCHYDRTAAEIVKPIMPNVQKLADAIAHQVMELNDAEPQAVLLVGGGALTPNLAKSVADALKLPPGRVAVRHPEGVEGIGDLPPALRLPDTVTPLGILKIASLNTLHFLTVYVNEEEYRLFNFRHLTISDALLSAGIQLKKFNGKTGLGIQLMINGQSQFFPGTMGTMATLSLDGAAAALDTPIQDGCHIHIEPGKDGVAPTLTLSDIAEAPAPYTLFLNGEMKHLAPELLINDRPAPPDAPLKDGDVVTARTTRTVGEALAAFGCSPTGQRITFTLNGARSQYTTKPVILVNDHDATLSQTLTDGDRIEYHLDNEPKLGDILDIDDFAAHLTIVYNGAETKIPSATVSLEVNERPATVNTIITEGSRVKYTLSEARATLVSTGLAAVGFVPPPSTSRVAVDIFVNGQPAQFTDPLKNGDALDIKIRPIEGGSAGGAEAPSASNAGAYGTPVPPPTPSPTATHTAAPSAAPPPKPAAPPDTSAQKAYAPDKAPASPGAPVLTDNLLGNYREQLNRESAEKTTAPPAPPEKKGWAKFR